MLSLHNRDGKEITVAFEFNNDWKLNSERGNAKTHGQSCLRVRCGVEGFARRTIKNWY